MLTRQIPPAPALDRRRLLAATLLVAMAPRAQAISLARKPHIEVWKGPNCGCCVDWIKDLEADGFVVAFHDTGNALIRQRLGMPERLGACHTAVVDGYVVEGHIWPRDIRRLLKERPKALGLAVPGMPFGTPGMDRPKHGGRVDPHDVLLVQRDGSTSVWQAYR